MSATLYSKLNYDLAKDFDPVSLLASTREIHGGGYNRLVGPDFQWRPRPTDSFTGQFLWSESRTPDRTDLTAQWDGRKLSDGAGLLYWSHSTRHEDWFLQVQSLGDEFRADNGFIPQVGYREAYAEAGYTFPYLFDETQAVAKAFHAACTPDFFLFDRNGKLAYRGQFDDGWDAYRERMERFPSAFGMMLCALDQLVGAAPGGTGGLLA